MEFARPRGPRPARSMHATILSVTTTTEQRRLFFDELSASAAHGTPSRYSSGCRCADCRGAHAARLRRYRARRKLERQGAAEGVRPRRRRAEMFVGSTARLRADETREETEEGGREEPRAAVPKTVPDWGSAATALAKTMGAPAPRAAQPQPMAPPAGAGRRAGRSAKVGSQTLRTITELLDKAPRGEARVELLLRAYDHPDFRSRIVTSLRQYGEAHGCTPAEIEGAVQRSLSREFERAARAATPSTRR